MKKHCWFVGVLMLCSVVRCTNHTTDSTQIDWDTASILQKAQDYLSLTPETITSHVATRSAGGIHDYYSEGSYWWPNPKDPEGPYIRRDGYRNPENFREHKNVLREFTIMVTVLVAAYQLSEDDQYGLKAIEHLNAWFVHADTRMNPSLRYAQAVKGISTGRGIGIIDTLRLINVALCIELLEEGGLLKGENFKTIQKWFGDFGEWLTTHPYGHDERDNNNNHSTWWGAQVAAYASVAKRADLLAICQTEFKKQLDVQMAEDGSFPDELGRTKPFHYMNYNVRGWTNYADLASTPNENLWDYSSKNGKLKKAIDFAVSFYKNPQDWPYQTELEKEIHPHRNDFLVMAYWGLEEEEYLNIWNELTSNKKDLENADANLLIWKHKFSK